MSARYRHSSYVSPDGVRMFVDWNRLGVGMSVFIPALNHEELKSQIGLLAKATGVIVRGHSRIEGGKYGMRFWRMV